MTQHDLLDLLHYNGWANQRIFPCTKQLSPEELLKAANVDHESAFQTLRHMLDVEWSWRLMAQLVPATQLLWEVEDVSDLAKVMAFWQREEATMLAYVQAAATLHRRTCGSTRPLLLAHDSWTTRQLLVTCQTLPDEKLDQPFAIDHHSLRGTFVHMIGNMEVWTDLLCERPVTERTGVTIPQLLERLIIISRDFTYIARKVGREQRYDDCFMDTLDNPPRRKTFGGAIGHLLTHSMHHRAHVMFLMEKVGLKEHIEGDLLGWESTAFGWD